MVAGTGGERSYVTRHPSSCSALTIIRALRRRTRIKRGVDENVEKRKSIALIPLQNTLTGTRNSENCGVLLLSCPNWNEGNFRKRATYSAHFGPNVSAMENFYSFYLLRYRTEIF